MDRGEFRIVDVQDILSGKFSSDNLREENQKEEEARKSPLTEAVPTKEPAKKVSKPRKTRKLPVSEELNARSKFMKLSGVLPEGGAKYPNAKSKILPVYERALSVTEHDRKAASLYKKNQKELQPPPMPVRDVEAKPLKCSTCPAEFSSEREMELHEVLHLVFGGGSLLDCDICEQGFWKRIDLIHHYKREHGQDLNVSKIKEKKVDMQKYMQILKEKSLTGARGGPTVGNSSNDARSTSVNAAAAAADNTVDVEQPRVENHAQTQCSKDDDIMILRVNCKLPNRSATQTKSEANDDNRYTLSYEGDGITTVVFLENSNNNNNPSA